MQNGDESGKKPPTNNNSKGRFKGVPLPNFWLLLGKKGVRYPAGSGILDRWKMAELTKKAQRILGIDPKKSYLELIADPKHELGSFGEKQAQSASKARLQQAEEAIRELIRATTEKQFPAHFTLAIDPRIPPKNIAKALEALADYYRACGGTGFSIQVLEK